MSSTINDIARHEKEQEEDSAEDVRKVRGKKRVVAALQLVKACALEGSRIEDSKRKRVKEYLMSGHTRSIIQKNWARSYQRGTSPLTARLFLV
mmetsp:Transcript_9148/g.14065  ORF Transcript_9148/g.14065 Transcript_9148/m.14065 type:complete len:93 (-) Transcript_9148:87-365(-)